MQSGTFATFTPVAAELGLKAKQNESAAEGLTSDLTCRTKGGPTMRPREPLPFFVWFTILIISVGSASLVVTYLMIDDFLALLR
jgi:hypothetical protein